MIGRKIKREAMFAIGGDKFLDLNASCLGAFMLGDTGHERYKAGKGGGGGGGAGRKGKKKGGKKGGGVLKRAAKAAKKAAKKVAKKVAKKARRRR
jgi:hypothetical protein